MTVWDGLTTLEAAAVLGISPLACRLRLSRARSQLRAHLDVARTTSSLPVRAGTSTPPTAPEATP